MDNNNCTCDENAADSNTSSEAFVLYSTSIVSALMTTILVILLLLNIQQCLTSRRRNAITLPALKKLKSNYSSISSEKKEKVEKCKKRITKVLGPDQPGRDKYIDAWKDWSTEDNPGSGTIAIRFKSPWFGPSVYRDVEMSMGVAESTMQREREGRRRLWKALSKTSKAKQEMESGDPKAKMKYKTAVKRVEWVRESIETEQKEREEDVENAALLWAIIWPEEVEKEQSKLEAKRLKKESEIV